MSPQKLKERIVGAFQAPIQRHKINVQIREIEKAVEDHDWDAVVKMAINTEYEMVGRYAVDVAAEAGQWKAVKIIGMEGKEPIAKYAVDVAAEAGQWDVVGDIAENGKGPAGAYARKQFEEFDISDVDATAKAEWWRVVKCIGKWGKEPIAKYAVDVAAEAGQWDVVGDIAHNRSEQDSVQKYAEELLKRHKQE